MRGHWPGAVSLISPLMMPMSNTEVLPPHIRPMTSVFVIVVFEMVLLCVVVLRTSNVTVFAFTWATHGRPGVG